MPGFIQRTNPLLIPESPMQFCPMLGALVGESHAIVLQQLQYWLTHSKNVINGEKWVFNTVDEWNLQFYWLSKSTLKRIFSKLRDFSYDGELYHLIKVKSLTKGSPIRWYTINYDDLDTLYPIIEQKSVQMKQKIYCNSTVLSCSSREKRILAQYPELALIIKKTEVDSNQSTDEGHFAQVEGQIDPQQVHSDHAEDLGRSPIEGSGFSDISSGVEGQIDLQQVHSDHAEDSNCPSLENKGVLAVSSGVEGQIDLQQVHSDHAEGSNCPSLENKGVLHPSNLPNGKSKVKLSFAEGQIEPQSRVNLNFSTNIQETTYQETISQEMHPRQDSIQKANTPTNPQSPEREITELDHVLFFFQQNIRPMLTLREQNELVRLVQTYGTETVLQGISTEKQYGGRSVAYLSAILTGNNFVSQTSQNPRSIQTSQPAPIPSTKGATYDDADASWNQTLAKLRKLGL